MCLMTLLLLWRPLSSGLKIFENISRYKTSTLIIGKNLQFVLSVFILMSIVKTLEWQKYRINDLIGNDEEKWEEIRSRDRPRMEQLSLWRIQPFYMLQWCWSSPFWIPLTFASVYRQWNTTNNQQRCQQISHVAFS